MHQPSEHRPTEAIVNLNAIQHNIEWILPQLETSQKLYAVVKADGYGHGAVAVSEAALVAGAQGLAVATVDEAIELRQAGLVQVPILVMGLTDPRGIAEILHYNITITVSDSAFFKKAYQQLQTTQSEKLTSLYKLTFHLALDTGMGRIGLRTREEIMQFKEEIAAYDWLNWEGVFTHFSTAGGGPEYYIDLQWENWLRLLADIPETVTERHYNNSAMTLWYPHAPVSTIVRFGIAMYGIDPKDDRLSETEQAKFNDSKLTSLKNLQPALELISEIIYVKEVPQGTSISYGATYETEDNEWIATIPIGYADGWLRQYQTTPVLVDGHACPVVGTINMDQMMIKLPKYYPVGTTVTLIGKDGNQENHVSDMARQMGTIGYEIMTSIGPRVPRIYLNEDEV